MIHVEEQTPDAGKANLAASLARWLTPRRVHAHAFLLAVCLWTVYAVDMSTPGLRDRTGLIKGADFLHFYTLGKLALEGRGNLLYDMQAQSAELAKFVPEAQGYVYVPLYGPQVSLFFAPFALLPYGWALAAWLSLNVLIYALCCYAVWKTCPNLATQKWSVLAAAIAFPGFFPPAFVGTDVGGSVAVFHPSVSGAASSSAFSGRSGARVFDLQASAWIGGGSDFHSGRGMAGGGRVRYCRGGSTWHGVVALRDKRDAELPACPRPRERCSFSA